MYVGDVVLGTASPRQGLPRGLCASRAREGLACYDLVPETKST